MLEHGGVRLSRMSMAVTATGSAAKATLVNSSSASRMFVSLIVIDLLLDGRGGGTLRAKRPAAFLLRSPTFLKLLKNFIHVEGGCLLPRRVVLKGHQEIAHVSLRRDQQVGVIQQPVIVGVRSDVRALVRVRSQVEDQRDP